MLTRRRRRHDVRDWRGRYTTTPTKTPAEPVRAGTPRLLLGKLRDRLDAAAARGRR